MTLPFERKNSIKAAREFLLKLIDPSKSKRIPREIRREAGSILRHYPWDLYLDQIDDCETCRKIIGDNWGQ